MGDGHSGVAGYVNDGDDHGAEDDGAEESY